MVMNPLANARDTGLKPGPRRPPGEGNDNPLQCSCLGNTMDRGDSQATVHGIEKELDTDLANEQHTFPKTACITKYHKLSGLKQQM